MYYRSLESSRTKTPLPSHYGGSTFRADGTFAQIPVRREYDLHPRGTYGQDVTPPEEDEVTRHSGESASEEEEVASSDISVTERGEHDPRKEEEGERMDEQEGDFFSRLLDGILPGVREDDLLLILLILLLSREKGNEDALVLLAFLLFAK